MERANLDVDQNLVREVVDRAVDIMGCDRACLLIHNDRFDCLECHYAENCAYSDNLCNGICSIPLSEIPAKVHDLIHTDDSSYLVLDGKELPTAIGQGSPESTCQVIVPRVYCPVNS